VEIGGADAESFVMVAASEEPLGQHERLPRCAP
jgi:hypothetical protein